MSADRALRVIALFVIATAYGCVPIPIVIPTFQESKTGHWNQQISPGTTTRGEVLAMLGSPSFRADNDRLFIFTAYRLDPLVGLLGVGYVQPGDLEMLAITFDAEGLVAATEEATESVTFYGQSDLPPVCLQNGVCWSNNVLLNAPDADADAKRFLPAAHGCAAYIYRSTVKSGPNERWSGKEAYLWIDGTAAGVLAARTYLRVELSPGLHEIDVTLSRSRTPERQRVQVDCRQDELVYLRIFAVGQGQHGYEWWMHREEVGARAQREVEQGRLVLGPLG
jgi:hypothetical protein